MSAAAVVSVAFAAACSNLGSPSDSEATQRAAEADKVMISAYNDYIQMQISPDDLDASIAKIEPAFNKLNAAYATWDQAMDDVQLPESAGDGLPSRSQLADFRLAMTAVLNQNDAALMQAKVCVRSFDPASCISENTGAGKVWDVAAFQRNADRLAATREALRNPPE